MKKIKKSLSGLIILAGIVLSLEVLAGTAAADQHVQLQANMDAVQRQAAILKHNVEYPDASRIQIVVSVSNNADYLPVKVLASVDGKELATYTYTAEDVDALKAGGMHTLWLGNLAEGAHKITAVVDGQKKNGKPVQFSSALSFQKGGSAQTLELQIKEEVGDSPSFMIRDGGGQ